MAKIETRLILDMSEQPTDIITMTQGDTNSRYLDVTLLNQGTPIDLTGQTVRIDCYKLDGTRVLNDGEVVDAATGRCKFKMTTEMLAVPDVLNTQISIWDDGNAEVVASAPFNIFIWYKIRNDESIESSNEYGTLVVLFQKIYDALDLMTTMVDNFGNPGEVAQSINVDTFWKMLEAVYSVNKDALENASVSEVLERIGQTTDEGATDSTGTVMGKLNAILQPQSVIKNIIKGTAAGKGSGSPLSVSVSVNVTNPKKCFVILNCALTSTGGDPADGIHFISLTTTTLTVATLSNNTFSYQIVEFN